MYGQTVTITAAQGYFNTATVQPDGSFSTTINTATMPLGHYNLDYDYTATNNFSLTYAPWSASVTVVKTNLIVGATDQYQVFYEGFVNGDTASTLGLNPIFSLSTDGKTISVTPITTTLVNYNPVYLTATLPTQMSPPNIGGGSGGSNGVSSWSQQADGNFGGPTSDGNGTDGLLVLDLTFGSSTYGRFVVKKHSN